jgi:hypothetical protein
MMVTIFQRKAILTAKKWRNSPANWIDPLGLCPPDDKQPSCLAICTKTYYGFGTTTTRAITVAAATPIPKNWLGLPRALGSGPFTKLPSWLSLGRGTAASGTNLVRGVGRLAGPIAIASGIIDAAAISMCETNYVPHWIEVIYKYDPFK